MADGNTKLIDYGIFEEESAMRAHVCVASRVVYVFKTKNVVDVIKNGDYRNVPVYTDGVITAMGYLVPPEDIPGCEEIHPPVKWWGKVAFKQDDSTTVKGEKAVTIVKGLLKHGLFPLYVEPHEITGHELQIKGLDIGVKFEATIQVKCDYNGGENGTGNLFIQNKECNPTSSH